MKESPNTIPDDEKLDKSFEGKWLQTDGYKNDHLLKRGYDDITYCGRTLYRSKTNLSYRKGNKCGYCKNKEKRWLEIQTYFQPTI